MGQESKNVAIIGAGASGCICAYHLLKAGIDVTLFDFGTPLRTLLPTGGGRCNLAHAEFDFKELAKNYPRGEKFLYSVFSRFSTADTLELFEEIGVQTYIQENGRIFPVSNSAEEVREKVLNSLKKARFIKEKVKLLEPLDNGFKIVTDKNKKYWFSDVVVAVGGRSGDKLIKNLGLNFIEQRPSLVGLKSEESFANLSGVVLKGVQSNDLGFVDDILFTHFGVSGPLIYKISSVNAQKDFPYRLSFNLYTSELNLQDLFNGFPKKELKNILSKLFPQRFAEYIAGEFGEITGCKVNSRIREYISDKIHNFEINCTGTNKDSETVSAGGIDLTEINPKTLEAKKYPGLYFIGEFLDIDGFCGGFNLQNAWSTAFVASKSIENF